FDGIIDLINMKDHFYQDDLGTKDETKEITEEYMEKTQELHTSLIEAVADHDEDLMMKYLEGEEVTADELKKAIRQATLDVEIYAVYCGSAFKNKGVQLVLDGVLDYLPAQTDVPTVEGIVRDSE